jgi:hypothetical protein
MGQKQHHETNSKRKKIAEREPDVFLSRVDDRMPKKGKPIMKNRSLGSFHDWL